MIHVLLWSKLIVMFFLVWNKTANQKIDLEHFLVRRIKKVDSGTIYLLSVRIKTRLIWILTNHRWIPQHFFRDLTHNTAFTASNPNKIKCDHNIKYVTKCSLRWVHVCYSPPNCIYNSESIKCFDFVLPVHSCDMNHCARQALNICLSSQSLGLDPVECQLS